MNLHSIRYFVEVARTLSFTEASKNLYVSQPGISQQIQLLEEQLGLKLLHRTTRKVELTEEGKYLYKKIRPSLSKIEHTISHLIQANAFPKRINIATIPSAASLYLPTVLKELHKLHPEVTFSIKETISEEINQLIKTQTYHLGFIRTASEVQEKREEGFDFMELGRSPINAIVSSKHPLANHKTIALKQLQQDYFIHYDPIQSPTLYEMVEHACAEAEFELKVVCTGSELVTISQLVSTNMGVTLLPKDMVKLISSPKIKALDLEDIQLKSLVIAIWEDDGYLNMHTKLMIQMLEKLKNDQVPLHQWSI